MYRKKITYLLFLSSFFIAIKAHAYESIDRVVAVVEEAVILNSDLDERIQLLRSQDPSLVDTEQDRRNVLEQLILEELQLRIARRVNLNINDSDIQNAITTLARGLAEQQISIDDYMRQRGFSDKELRDSIKREITLRRVQEGNINNRIRITDREIDEFLESKAGKDWLEPRFNLGHILLNFNENTNEEAVIRQAQTLYQALSSGQSFRTIAQQFSQGPNAPKGGDLGWRTQDNLPELFYQQVNLLESGEVTQPFRSNAGIHLLKVYKRSGAKPVMVERFKTRHILVKSSELFSDAEAKTKIDALYQQLLSGSDFATLAKEHTDDTGSKQDGGDLGWSTPGKFVPAFEQTMQSTPVGSFSQPFKSQFGWHVLLVEEQKIEDMFETVKRNQVASILRQRRFEDELQLWLQEIREDAYVEVLI